MVVGFDFPFLGFRENIGNAGGKRSTGGAPLPDIYQGLEVDVGGRVCLMMNSVEAVLFNKKSGKVKRVENVRGVK